MWLARNASKETLWTIFRKMSDHVLWNMKVFLFSIRTILIVAVRTDILLMLVGNRSQNVFLDPSCFSEKKKQPEKEKEKNRNSLCSKSTRPLGHWIWSWMWCMLWCHTWGTIWLRLFDINITYVHNKMRNSHNPDIIIYKNGPIWKLVNLHSVQLHNYDSVWSRSANLKFLWSIGDKGKS